MYHFNFEPTIKPFSLFQKFQFHTSEEFLPESSPAQCSLVLDDGRFFDDAPDLGRGRFSEAIVHQQFGVLVCCDSPADDDEGQGIALGGCGGRRMFRQELSDIGFVQVDLRSFLSKEDNKIGFCFRKNILRFVFWCRQ